MRGGTITVIVVIASLSSEYLASSHYQLFREIATELTLSDDLATSQGSQLLAQYITTLHPITGTYDISPLRCNLST